MKRKNNIFYDKTLSKRHKSAKRFKFYAIFSLVLSISFLVFFLCDMFVKGLPALKQTYIKVDITYTSKCMKELKGLCFNNDCLNSQKIILNQTIFKVDNIYQTCQALADAGVTINRPPRDGRMAFITSPDNISIELLQEGDALAPAEPWLSMENTGSW